MVGLARRGGGTITVRVLVVRDNSIPRTTGEGSNLVDRTSCGVSAGNGCGQTANATYLAIPGHDVQLRRGTQHGYPGIHRRSQQR